MSHRTTPPASGETDGRRDFGLIALVGRESFEEGVLGVVIEHRARQLANSG
jgi:hypothetical protein